MASRMAPPLLFLHPSVLASLIPFLYSPTLAGLSWLLCQQASLVLCPEVPIAETRATKSEPRILLLAAVRLGLVLVSSRCNRSLAALTLVQEEWERARPVSYLLSSAQPSHLFLLRVPLRLIILAQALIFTNDTVWSFCKRMPVILRALGPVCHCWRKGTLDALQAPSDCGNRQGLVGCCIKSVLPSQ